MGVDVARQTLALAAIILLSTLPLAAHPDKQAEPLPVTGVPAPELASLDELLLAFLRENEIAGASLAITKEGRLVYARGFGWADPDGQVKVSPTSLFRIASISKPITAVAILMLIERGKLKLDDKAFDLIALQPLPGRERDPRLKDITVRHLLEHTAGFDRAKSFDPMFRPVMIAKELDVPPPAQPEHIIRYMLGQPLDFDPGSRHAYSNYGYCVLGRIIERVSGQAYETFVRHEVLKPLGITRTKLGKTLVRAADEVRYRDAKSRTAPAILGPDFGKPVPAPYGAWHLEAMDAHGGWISSAVDLVRFAAALDRPQQCPILKSASIDAMFARPAGRAGHDDAGQPLPAFYSLGWMVRPEGNGRNTWHMGSLDGTATVLMRRHDGVNWVVLFNARSNARNEYLGKLIDPLINQAMMKVQRWPATAIESP